MTRLDLFVKIYKRERDIYDLNLRDRMLYMRFLSKVEEIKEKRK